jgi:hypothetical protein
VITEPERMISILKSTRKSGFVCITLLSAVVAIRTGLLRRPQYTVNFVAHGTDVNKRISIHPQGILDMDDGMRTVSREFEFHDAPIPSIRIWKILRRSLIPISRWARFSQPQKSNCVIFR